VTRQSGQALTVLAELFVALLLALFLLAAGARFGARSRELPAPRSPVVGSPSRC
jgi:hypothetical protein